MSSSLKVIALISGGKDSFCSILHCLANGHSVVALANLYPASDENQSLEDINSFMYQTVGHTIIPLYEQALGIPLYRQEIVGEAVNLERDYEIPQSHLGHDETESLVPLLRKAMETHPEANAICTGAILSTYQRTRVESVALRLGLTPLSFLWQYPSLPPYKQSALLHDMAAVGQDARIIKVASGGLDQTFLWDNVADPRTITRLSNAVARFCDNGDGAVLGEGGEFETLAIDGPAVLWKNRIEVELDSVVVGDGGTAIWKGKAARLAEKEGGKTPGLEALRIPDLWDDEFKKILDTLNTPPSSSFAALSPTSSSSQSAFPPILAAGSTADYLNLHHSSVSTLTLSARTCSLAGSIRPDSSTQLKSILLSVVDILKENSLDTSSIMHTTLLLRNMSDFAAVNAIYSTFFPAPNPPSRVTVACGDTLPADVDVMLSVIAARNKPINKSLAGIGLQSTGKQNIGDAEHISPHLEMAVGERKAQRKGLHVQSRSYWAPANIGPYSQAISTPLPTKDDAEGGAEVIYVAGQIPLVPASMEVFVEHGFKGQAVLALQHLWRIGRTMQVRRWVAGVAYISDCSNVEADSRVRIAQATWKAIHEGSPKQEDGDEDENEEEDAVDPWDMKNLRRTFFNDSTPRSPLPDPHAVPHNAPIPPCFIVQVAQLPRNVDIEWSSTGLANGGQTSVSRPSRRPPVMQSDPAASKSRFYSIEITEDWKVPDKLMALCEWDHCTLYAAPDFPFEWRGIKGLQWVPCKRVWGDEGTRVRGVLVGRLDPDVGSQEWIQWLEADE